MSNEELLETVQGEVADAPSSVRIGCFRDRSLPLVYLREGSGPSLESLLEPGGHRIGIQQGLLAYGAILFRNFGVSSAEQFYDAVQSWSAGLLAYDYGSTPRRKVFRNVYTSTEYPRELPIPLHNEHSYTTSWPGELWFYCDDDRFSRGETPLADSRRVYDLLDVDLKKRFCERQLLYVRRYSDFIDLSWQQAFQTDSRAAVESYCLSHGIQYSWTGPNQLTTKQIAQAVVQHPVTGDMSWFNQAHLFHHSSADSELKSMLNEIGEQLPRNVYFSDGGEIPADDLQNIRDTFLVAEQAFPWRKGDVLLLDNVSTAHGRRPFTGQRRILVAMTSALAATSV